MDTMKRLVAATVPAADNDRGSVSTTSGSDGAQHALQRKPITDFSG